MITPVFEITQNDNFIFINIKVPYSKTIEADVYIDGTDFRFYLRPYFLRLKLPAEIVEDERSGCMYDTENGEYKLKVGKAEKGLYFNDLDMITKLIATKKQSIKQPLIEVISGGELDKTHKLDEEETASSDLETLPNSGYGFANQKSGLLGKLEMDVLSVLQVKNIEGCTSELRREYQTMHENESFSADHYLADYFESAEIKKLRKLQPPWRNEGCDDSFSDDQKYLLKNFPNIEYILDQSQLKDLYNGLADILFSYSYNWRCTEGEYCVESPWNIKTCSAVLSWSTYNKDIHKTMVSSYRRTLIFPLYRNFDLAKTCLRDVICILEQGKKYILKCLLDIYKLFSQNDPYYILNDLYIRDYCIWIQSCSESVLQSLANSLKELNITKSCLDLDLVDLEKAAFLVLQEEEEDASCASDVTDDLCNEVKKLAM